MKGLTVIHNGKVMASSQLIAEKFGKFHRNVMRAIEDLDCSEEFKVLNFEKCFFTNKMNRKYEGYMLTRDGFSFLCMGFTGKKAAAWKESYIKAFNMMEAELLKKHHDIEWKQARVQSIGVRREVTDTIKEFVEYATNQGSKSASMYYSNITKMEYAALELVTKGQRLPKDFRDTLDKMDLCFLMTAEYTAKNAIQRGMSDGLHYKEIYQLAKEKVCAFAETVRIVKLS